VAAAIAQLLLDRALLAFTGRRLQWKRQAKKQHRQLLAEAGPCRPDEVGQIPHQPHVPATGATFPRELSTSAIDVQNLSDSLPLR